MHCYFLGPTVRLLTIVMLSYVRIGRMHACESLWNRKDVVSRYVHELAYVLNARLVRAFRMDSEGLSRAIFLPYGQSMYGAYPMVSCILHNHVDCVPLHHI